MLTELKKQQEAGFALQPGLPEKQAQLKIYKKFLQKAQDLTSLLEELKSQGNYLLECTKNPSFSEEPWLEVKHLHESLLQQLQVRRMDRSNPVTGTVTATTGHSSAKLVLGCCSFAEPKAFSGFQLYMKMPTLKKGGISPDHF